MATLNDLSFPHFPGNRGGRMASGGLVAASCVPDQDEENVQVYSQITCRRLGTTDFQPVTKPLTG